MDRFSGISVFVKVAETGSQTAAAKALGLSKATVSKHLAELEDRLGVRLLNRTTRRSSLTEVGQAYFERCRRSVAEAEEAELAITSLQAEPRGLLRINAPMTFGVQHIAPMLPVYLNRFPELSVELVFNDRQVDLIEEGFDVGIRIANLPDSSLIARKLAPCRRIVCASPAYWDRHGRPSHPTELTKYDCLIYEHLLSPLEWPFEGPEGPIRVRVSGKIRANNGEALVEAAIQGLGAYLCPTFFCGEALGDGRLELVLEDYEDRNTSIFAIYPHSRHLSAKVRTFVDFLVECFGPEPYWDHPV